MNCCNLVNLVEDYYAASSQAVNLNKLCVFFGANTLAAMSMELGQVLNMHVVSNSGTYLGVPAMWGKSKRQCLAYVKGRILRKLQGWKQSTLSQVGR